jgi:Skp family chaperone for outer membrane proteins
VIEVLYAAVPLYSKPSHVEPYQLHEVNYRLLKANIETLGQLKTFIANKPIEEFNKLVLYPKVSGKVQQALKDDQLQRGCVYLEKSQRKVVNRIERLNRKQRKERAKLKRKSEKQQLTDKQKAEQEKLVQEKLAQERLAQEQQQKQKEQQQMSQDIKQQVLQSLKDPSTLLSQNESSK